MNQMIDVLLPLCCFLQTVKYLGLLGLNTMMQKEPRVVSEYKDIVLQCLKDEDVSIRMRARDLLNGMVRPAAVQYARVRARSRTRMSKGLLLYLYM